MIPLNLDDCEALALTRLSNIVFGGKLPKGGGTWCLGNELKPSDLYCYLIAKFGPPNGIQNLFKTDDSDNLIHWEWALAHKNELILIMGLGVLLPDYITDFRLGPINTKS